jgi:glycosyltransferase involved in cell wall biosynthesis
MPLILPQEFMMIKENTLYMVVPCYNEEAVLHETANRLKEKYASLIERGMISHDSRVVFVNDGSKDKTWDIIQELHNSDSATFSGINLARNSCHQNAVLAGLMTVKDICSMAITMDADLQDDTNAIDAMVEKYHEGNHVVYGVRSARNNDTFFKKFTAEGFYKFMSAMGADVVYNHADFRLMSRRVLQELANYREVNLFLRGMVPLIGFQSCSVYYERAERFAGESKYPLKKMLALAFDGITSLSVKPIRMITAFGIFVALLSFVGILWSVIVALLGKSVVGWASVTCILCFLGGVQLVSLGVIGEYVGKIYLETKKRPRFIISERTDK